MSAIKGIDLTKIGVGKNRTALGSVSAINANKTLSGATDIRANETFKVVFNKAIDATTVKAGNFVIKKGDVVVPSNVTLASDKMSVTITPVNTLDVKTDYTLTVSKDVKLDGAQGTLGTDSVFAFTTADAAVVTMFKVDTVELKDGPFTTTNLGNGVHLTFNKDLDAATVNATNVKLFNVTDGVYAPATPTGIAYDETTKIITFVPTASAVKNNKVYELRLSNVVALDGSSADGYAQQFSVGSAASATVTVPTDVIDGATNGDDHTYGGLTAKEVKLNATNNVTGVTSYSLPAFKATVSFGKAMDSSTINTNTIKLVEYNSSGDKVGDVQTSVTYDANSYSAIVTPTADLKENTTYQVEIADNTVKDSLGIAVAKTTKSFTTGDFTVPSVSTTNIADGTRLASNKPLKVTFSEKMSLTTFVNAAGGSYDTLDGTHSVKLLKADGTGVQLATVTVDATDTTGKTLLIMPNSGAWDVNTTYKLTLKGYNYDNVLSVADETGNMLANDYTLTFTTADSSVPQVTSVKGFANGYIGANPNVELLGSTDKKYIAGLEEDGTATNEAIYVYFNRVVDGDFLNVAKYTLSIDGGVATALTGVNWTASLVADSNGDNTIIKLVPTGAGVISGEHKYVLTVKKDDATTDSKKLADDVSVYFTTENAAEAMAATPLKTNDGGSAAVSATTTAANLNKGLEIAFTENPLVSTINSTNIKIEDTTAGTTLVGTFYDSQAKGFLSTATGATATGTSVWFFPADTSNNFVAGHKYKVTVSGVQDAYFNAIKAPFVTYFTTADETVPTVANTSVTNGQEGVSIQPTFTVTFDKDVSATAPSATTITLTDSSLTAVDCQVKYDSSTKTATIKPIVTLKGLAQYTLHVDNTIASTVGSLGADTNIVFTTEDKTTSPSIASAVYYDANGSTSVDAGDVIRVKLSEAVDTTAIDNANDFTIVGLAGATLGTSSVSVTPVNATNGFTDTIDITLGATPSVQVGLTQIEATANGGDATWTTYAGKTFSSDPVTITASK